MSSAPLAERMRPMSLEGYVGQRHIVGPKGALQPALDQSACPLCCFGDLQAWERPPWRNSWLRMWTAHLRP